MKKTKKNMKEKLDDMHLDYRANNYTWLCQMEQELKRAEEQIAWFRRCMNFDPEIELSENRKISNICPGMPIDPACLLKTGTNIALIANMINQNNEVIRRIDSDLRP